MAHLSSLIVLFALYSILLIGATATGTENADTVNRFLLRSHIASTPFSSNVEAKTFGQHRGSVKVGADFVLTKDFMFNLNAEYSLATYGDENSYGGGFRYQF